jgi:ABC-type transporter Mla subunit MlaD
MPLNIGSLLRTPSDLAAALRSVLGWTDEAVQVVAELPARVAALMDDAERLVARVGDTLERVDDVVGRVEGVVGDAQALVGRVDGVATRAAEVAEGAAAVADRAAAVADRAGAVADRAGAVADRAGAVAEGAAAVADRAGAVADRADQVVEQIIPVTGAAEGVLESVGTTSAGAQALLEVFQPMTERGAPLLQHFIDEFSVEELQALIKLVDQVPEFTEHMESDIMPILATLDRVGPDVHELLEVLKDVRLAIQGVPGFSLFRRRGAELEDELADERPEA